MESEQAEVKDTAIRSEPALAVRSASKTFAGFVALDQVDLQVDRGEVVALLGQNGSGKSTLIKIISGYHAPDFGCSVTVDGRPLVEGSPEASERLGCRFVHQDLGLIANLSVYDNMGLGGRYVRRWGSISPSASRRAFREQLQLVGLSLNMDAKLSDLAPSARAGIAIARALRPDSEHPVRMLVLDEPSAALAADEVDQLHQIVRTVAKNGVGILYVTHMLEEVMRLADRAVILRDGRVVASRATADTNEGEIASLMVGHEWKRAERRAVEVVGSLSQDAAEASLRVSGLETNLLHSVSFEARPGEILGLAGITGSGREELLPAIFGGIPRLQGTVEVEGRTIPALRPDVAVSAGVAFLPPDRKLLGAVMTLSAAENLTLARLRDFSGPAGTLALRREREESIRWFDQLDIRPAQQVDKPFAEFSGGNQQKILFAKWLRIKPAVMLLDGPSEGVDIAAREKLHLEIIKIAAAGVAVVVASNDIDELAWLSTRVIVLRGGQIRDVLTGADINTHAINRSILESNDVSASEAEEWMGRTDEFSNHG